MFSLTASVASVKWEAIISWARGSWRRFGGLRKEKE